MTSVKDDAPTRPAVFPASRYALFTVIALVGVAVDLWTKSWIFGRLWPPDGIRRPVQWIWPRRIGLEVTLNEGALFGWGEGLVWMFVILSVAAAAGILYWLFVVGEAQSLWLTIALGAITAGILGNLYDRIGLHGLAFPVGYPQSGETAYAVRDWILFQWNDDVRWPNFNAADSWLVGGAIMLLLHSFRTPSSQQTPAAND
jgi:signal peptidase II